MPIKDISVILLAGGTGSRMESAVPKQYMPLLGKPLARHSFELFSSLTEVKEVIVVCRKDYQHHFALPKCPVPIRFAEPGPRRQDSVYNGLQSVTEPCQLVCIHDSARPLVKREAVDEVLKAAREHEAAVLAVPVKATIKQSSRDGFVRATLDRSTLWEVQTPQVIALPLLRRAFQHALENGLEVTDDVSLVEALGQPVKLVTGCYSNLKITTSEDLAIAQYLSSSR